jgi:ribosomal-protein-alanine N-acetyltransferase
MIAFYANEQSADFAYIPHVYVSPGYRDIGVFSRLLNSVVGYVKRKGLSEIRLEVRIDNNIAQSAYKKNGFVQCGSVNPNSIYMSLILNMN